MKYSPRLKLSILALAIGLAFSACSKDSNQAKLLSDAQAAIDQGDFNTASIQLKNLVQNSPNQATARLALGHLGLRMGDFATAESEATKALELGADERIARVLLWEALAMQGQFKKIIEQTSAFKSNDPLLTTQALVYAGRSQYALKDLDVAKANFEAALKTQPESTTAEVGLILVLLAQDGDKLKAKASLNALLAKTPDLFEVQALSGTLLAGEGKFAEAKVALSKALALRPYEFEQRASLIHAHIFSGEYKAAESQIQTLRKMAPRNPLASYLAGLNAFVQGDLQTSGEHLQSFAQQGVDFIPGIELAAEVAMRSGQWARSEALAKNLLSKNSQSIRAQRLLAGTYLGMGSPERALSILAPLMQTKIKDAELYAMTGEALMLTGDKDRGLQYLDAAVAASGNASTYRIAAGNARVALGDQAGGIELLEGSVATSGGTQADLVLARSLATAKRYDKALELVNRFIQAHPKDPQGPFTQGIIQTAKGLIDEGYQSYSQALELSPSFLPALDALSVLDLGKGKGEAAIARFEAISKANPKNVGAFLAQARLAARSGLGDEKVLGYLKKARDLDPSSALAAIDQARYFTGSNRPERAIQALEPLLQTHSGDAQLVDQLAQAYESTQAYAKAIQLLEKALQGDSLSGALNFRIGMNRLALKDFVGALASFQRVAALQPNAIEPKAAIANTLYASGKRDEGMAAAKDLTLAFAKNPIGLTLLGDFALSESKVAQSLTYYQQAFQIKGSPGTASKLLGAYYAANQPEAARTFLQQWWSAHPEDSSTMILASNYLIERKSWKEVAAVLNEVLKRNPNHTAALNNAAMAVHALKEPKAIQLIERAYQLEPHNVSILDTYGVISSDQGKHEQAVQLLRQALTNAPGHREVRLHLAQALMKQGERKLAQLEANKVLSLNTQDDIGQQARALLQ